MSWSVNASGKKSDVHAKIDEQIKPHHALGDQVLEFERARVMCHSLVDSMKYSHVSISGSGSYDSVSVSGSSWEQNDEVAVAAGASGSGEVGTGA